MPKVVDWHQQPPLRIRLTLDDKPCLMVYESLNAYSTMSEAHHVCIMAV